jgi:hypothetical protein
MLFIWLRRFARLVVWLFRVPDARDVARVDPNLKCPVCGARNASRPGHFPIRCVERASGTGEHGGRIVVLVQHTCVECGARHYGTPVVKVGPDMVGGAIPRNDTEVMDEKLNRSTFMQPQTETPEKVQ